MKTMVTSERPHAEFDQCAPSYAEQLEVKSGSATLTSMARVTKAGIHSVSDIHAMRHLISSSLHAASFADAT